MWRTTFFLLVCGQAFSQQFVNFEEVFQGVDCIPGKISTDESGQLYIETSGVTQMLPKEQVVVAGTSIMEEKTDTEIIGKNALMMINELCFYNKIQYKFDLVEESGLPHQKKFVIELTMGNEEYTGIGHSIKSAQHVAADEALLKTKYLHPPEKNNLQKQQMPMTPTMELNNLALKLGIKLEYINENSKITTEVDLDNNVNYYTLDQNSKGYLQKLNDSLDSKFENMKITSGGGPAGGAFRIALVMGENTFHGEGFTVQSAKHDCASKAIEFMKNLSFKDPEECIQQGIVCDKISFKTPITQINEIAQKEKIKVIFDIISESGLPHDKQFISRCRMGDFTAEGSGHTKKAAKQKAAEKMMSQIKELHSIGLGSEIMAPTSSERQQSPKKKKKKNVVLRKGTGVVDYLGQSMMDSMASVYKAFSNPDKEESKYDSNQESDLDGNENAVSYKGELLNLCQQIGLNVEFSTFSENDKFNTIITLKTDVTHICQEVGKSIHSTEENASLKALRFIKSVGIANILTVTKKSPTLLPTKPKETKIAFDNIFDT